MKIIAFTGAGISKDSGIDTFQERPGIREFLTRDVATNTPELYLDALRGIMDNIKGKLPNDAHMALYEYGIEVITMNVDGLHEAAGSEPLTLHGTLPSDNEMHLAHKLLNKPVLYGDPAPNYYVAEKMICDAEPGSILLVIGASESTVFSVYLRDLANRMALEVVEIQNNASTEVRAFLEKHKLLSKEGR